MKDKWGKVDVIWEPILGAQENETEADLRFYF